MNFGQAIEALKQQKCVARAGWNGKGMHLRLMEPPPTPVGQPRSLPYIEMTTVQGDLVPWLASQTDMLAEDWKVVGAWPSFDECLAKEKGRP